MEIYIVRPGDTLSSIARAYGTSVQKLAFDNGIEDAHAEAGDEGTDEVNKESAPARQPLDDDTDDTRADEYR